MAQEARWGRAALWDKKAFVRQLLRPSREFYRITSASRMHWGICVSWSMIRLKVTGYAGPPPCGTPAIELQGAVLPAEAGRSPGVGIPQGALAVRALIRSFFVGLAGASLAAHAE